MENEVSEKEKSIMSPDDWAVLLPFNVVQLGTTTINISPLTIKSFSYLSSKSIHLLKKLMESGFFSQDINLTKSYDVLIALVLSEAPEILAGLTGIPEVDIVRLPLSKLGELVSSAVEINTRDREVMEKNLEGLAGLIKLMTGMLLTSETQTTRQASPDSA